MSALRTVFVLFVLTFTRGLTQEGDLVDESTPIIDEEPPVVTLAQDNFTEYVQDKRIMLVEFYAPWCGHCKQLEPEYEVAAEKLKEHDIPLAKVDATANEEIARKYEIQGYPTMKVFRSGTPYDYDGPRKTDGIVEYMLNEARPDWQPPLDRVLVLTQDNFTQTVEESPIILVEFYAPWCGHCKRLAPDYTKAATVLHDQGTNVLLAKVDATVEKDLATEYGVEGFPTLKIFRHGRVSEYKGPREGAGIVNYMFKQSLPPTIPLLSKNDLVTYTKSGKPTVVGFFETMEDAHFQEYSDAANEGRESQMLWLHCSDPEIAKVYNIEFGMVAVFMPRQFYNKHEKKIKIYKGSFDVSSEELMNNLKQLGTPLVGMRTKTNAEHMYTRYPLFVGYISLEDGEDSFGYWNEKVLLPLALKYPNMQFALSDEQEFKNEVQSLQLHDRGDDLLVGILGPENKRYAYEDEDISVDGLNEFIEAFMDDELKPVRKSQSAPSKQTGPVKVVVGDTFKDIVEDPEKDVLIEFYAPWCGHCKALEPVYSSLAKKFKKNDKLVIAKIDGTENEFPEYYKVSGFPTIYFVPAGENSLPILYEGERELKKFVKFLKKNAVVSLDSSKKKKSKGKDEL